jgi:hypothetical protein
VSVEPISSPSEGFTKLAEIFTRLSHRTRELIKLLESDGISPVGKIVRDAAKREIEQGLALIKDQKNFRSL